MGYQYVNEVSLLSQFLAIYRTMNDLGLHFMFDNTGDCNLTLMREFYTNWVTDTKYKYVQVLNEVLGTLECDADIFNDLKDKPPYREVQHTLCGVESNSR